MSEAFRTAVGLLSVLLPLAAARADQWHGINAGAPVWDGVISFSAAKAGAIAATGCRAVRINFRLDNHASWDSTILGKYDTVVNNAINNGLVVLGLLCNECMSVGQASWNDDPDGDGLNQYVTDYAQTALLLADRYKFKIKRWEIWNEPDAWTNSNYQSDPQNAGGTYILPRVYANLLAQTYLALNSNGHAFFDQYGVRLVSGGLFAHDINDSFTTGMEYMQQVYAQAAVWDGLQAAAGRRYPWDFFGWHFYLNQGSRVSTTEIGSYLSDVRTRQAASNDATPILITEFGWDSGFVGEQTQSDNLRRSCDYLEGKSYIAGTYWYQWQDESPTVLRGIVRADDSHKPAYDEFTAQNGASAYPAPLVHVDAQPDTITTGQSVHFTPTVTLYAQATAGSAVWHFGSVQQPVTGAPVPLDHQFTSAGAVSVWLEVTDSTGAAGTSNTLIIHVNPPPPPKAPDFDNDGDVDQADFAHLQACFSGPYLQDDPTCQDACLDGDCYIDQQDLAIFLDCVSGPGLRAAPGCTNAP